MKRIKLFFAGLEVEFTDRDKALGQIEELARKGTRFPLVIYGPEGCGKTALFMQTKKILEEYNYNVIYTNPMTEKPEEILQYSSSIKDIVKEVFNLFPEPYSRIVDVAITIASQVMKRFRKSKIAILMDDIFQAVGLDKAEVYVKTLLNLIEYPPGDYENIVILVSSSEGITRERVGRHNWADMKILWNMNKNGFRELYSKLPNNKPSFENIWNLTGGNPRYLERLYEVNWNLDLVLNWVIRTRKLRSFIKSLNDREIDILKEILEDPDKLFERLREPEAQTLEKKLIELNMIIEVWDRDEWSWIDTPPPERDPELGIGRYYAWQTPLHREAVRRVLEQLTMK